MSTQSLRIAGRDFVLISKREFDRMQAKLKALNAEERGDIAEAKRRAKEPSISLHEVFRDVIGKGKHLPADGSVQHDHYIHGTPKR